MAYFEWTETLNVHVDQFNEEHKKLIGFMNVLYDACHDGKSDAEVQVALNEFVLFALKHFEHEEAYLKSIDFPEYDRHCEMHEQLKIRFNNYVQLFERTRELPEDFFHFLEGWLLNHIALIDAQYAPTQSAKK
jgi:hemerythrin